jgi:hypothetical protein
MDLPVSLAPQVTARNLKETVGTIVCHNLFVDASRTSDLLAVFAVEEVLERVEAVV